MSWELARHSAPIACLQKDMVTGRLTHWALIGSWYVILGVSTGVCEQQLGIKRVIRAGLSMRSFSCMMRIQGIKPLGVEKDLIVT